MKEKEKEKEFRNSIISILETEFNEKKDDKRLQHNQNLFFDEENKKRIYLEERDAFYQNKPGYIKIVNEIGEDEWIREEDLKQREGYFNFEEDMEDADTHKRKLFIKYLITTLILGTILAIFIPIFIVNTGYIEVKSNVKDAYIFLDGNPTGLLTNNTLEEISVGRHVVKVALKGYTVTPDSIIVEVKSEEGITIDFKLLKTKEKQK